MERVSHENSLGPFPICPEHKQRLEKIILHEAGHCVIAKKLGFHANQIKICLLYQGGQYDCYVVNDTARRLQNNAAILRFLDERILTLFSGAMAEALTDGKVDNEAARAVLESDGGRNDQGKISELICLLSNIRHADLTNDSDFKDALTSMTIELWDKARVLVEAEQDIISGLSKKLASKIEVGGEEYLFSEEDIEALLVEAYKAGRND